MNPTKIIAAGVLVATAALGAGALAPAQAHQPAAATADRAGSYTVTASVNHDEPVVGDRVKIKGSVKPAAPGAEVRLQVRYENRKTWKTLDTTRLSRTSKYKFKDKVGSVRERKYRVVKPAGAHRAAGRSPSVKVTVFGWRPLTSINAATTSGFVSGPSVHINGVAYPKSLYTFSGPPQPYTIDYNLNRDCKAIQARFGLDDSSSVAGTATLALATDGTSRYSGTFGLTQSQAVTLDLTTVFRVTISATTAGGGVAAVASPEVLCSF